MGSSAVLVKVWMTLRSWAVFFCGLSASRLPRTKTLPLLIVSSVTLCWTYNLSPDIKLTVKLPLLFWLPEIVMVWLTVKPKSAQFPLPSCIK